MDMRGRHHNGGSKPSGVCSVCGGPKWKPEGGKWRCDVCAKRRARECELRRFGLTIAAYGLILESQGGRCAICLAAPKDTRLHVDHNHRTGKVRGLLCFQCNALLGLASCIKYLT